MCYNAWHNRDQKHRKTMQQPNKTTPGTSRRERLIVERGKIKTSDDYLKILEEAKKQYQPYVELGRLCELLESMREEQTTIKWLGNKIKETAGALAPQNQGG